MDDNEIYDVLSTVAELSLMIRDNRTVSDSPMAQEMYQRYFSEEEYVH